MGTSETRVQPYARPELAIFIADKRIDESWFLKERRRLREVRATTLAPLAGGTPAGSAGKPGGGGKGDGAAAAGSKRLQGIDALSAEIERRRDGKGAGQAGSGPG